MPKHLNHPCLLSLLAALAFSPAFAATAPSASPAGKVGRVDITADSSTAAQGYIVYQGAHLKTDTGSTLDADTVRANLASATNALQNIVATGHVRVHTAPGQGRSYTATSDKAIYEPGSNKIEFPDPVTISIISPATNGPLVQTGDSAVVQLGQGPEYPQVMMNRVHTTFTPAQ
jgi:lipopolysaccharide export system protein LptA